MGFFFPNISFVTCISSSHLICRFGNKSLEIQLAHVMTVHMNGSPADLGVKAKLRLQSHDQNVNDIPYKPAIEELRSISSQVTLLGKLESLGTYFEFIQMSLA